MRRFDRPAFAAILFVGGVAVSAPARAAAQTALSGDPIRVARLARPVVIDGRVNVEEWVGNARIETWYETNPGDNTVPAVRNVGYVAFDDRFFYAAFEFGDPAPAAIRAPYSDRDRISGNATDYGGIILDTRNDGHRAVLLLTTPSGVQYDAVTDDDGGGEDSSPDFFWESAARITERGWTLEIRVPFSSLRYRDVNPQTWGIFLYRNYPRGFRYQFFSARLPRGGNCFICRTNPLVGLENLPAGGHLVAAPYVSANQLARPSGALGSGLRSDGVDGDVGLDLKWTPDADNALDFTLKPDFSQVESDTAQISANERFALLFQERRPFFLEGVELFSTPIRAVYTRTITAPRWGARATGMLRGANYTVLVAEDDGGGSVVVPGPYGSTLAPQAFASTVLVARVKRNVGRSFASVLVTGREAGVEGSSWLAGPDFQWRPSTADVVAGQWVFSRTVAPNRPDLSTAWRGDILSGSAAQLQWERNTTHLDVSAIYKDIGDGFRADAGLVPQVGYRETLGEAGWTLRPRGVIARQRTFINVNRQVDRTGALINRNAQVGTSVDTRLNGFFLVRFYDDRVRSGSTVFRVNRVGYVAQASPSRRISFIGVDGMVGEEVDFANERVGRGATVNISATLNPTNHFELALVRNVRWLRVAAAAGGRRRTLFTARVSRVRGTYTFTARSFARAIVQYVSTDRDAALFRTIVADRSGTFLGSVLFAYKVNWQSVLFAGYGDDRELSSEHRLERSGRQFFVKMSYAFQR